MVVPHIATKVVLCIGIRIHQRNTEIHTMLIAPLPAAPHERFWFLALASQRSSDKERFLDLRNTYSPDM